MIPLKNEIGLRRKGLEPLDSIKSGNEKLSFSHDLPPYPVSQRDLSIPAEENFVNDRRGKNP